MLGLDTPKPGPGELEALFEQLSPMPVTGQAWPRWVKVLTWAVVAIVGVQILRVATGAQAAAVNPMVAGAVLVCFLGLLLVARAMSTSQTTISREGIEQSWITRRRISWEEIQFAKFIPMIASKRLVCFTRSGRPIVFQAGTPQLQAAFARISLLFRRR